MIAVFRDAIRQVGVEIIAVAVIHAVAAYAIVSLVP